MNTFEIINETDEKIVELKKINELIDFALKKEKLDNVEFNIIIVNNERIKQINKEYRNIDRETDVISFALEDYKDITLPYRLLGDIYISIDKAKSQAVDYGHSLLRELGFFSIHGLLHLLGYDHIKEEEEKVMFTRQEEILNEFGLTKK